MKAKEFLNEHLGLIEESLQDHRHWFEEDDPADANQINQIDKCLEDINEIEDL